MPRFLWPLTLLPLLAIAGFAADFAAGLHAYQKGDYSAAAQQWLPLAEKGDSRAQFNVGLLYVDGQGVTQDYGQAAKWFERAAEQGYGKAQLNLGAMYGVGKGVKRDYVQAYKWLNVCAAGGDSKCASQRDLVAKKLKPKQLAKAQELSSDFTPHQEPGK